jgi:anti-anti-sigma factor
MSDTLLLPDLVVAYGDAPEFACSWGMSGADSAWVHVSGEIDIATIAQLREALRQAQFRAHLVVLDLRDLAFIDCSGVAAIVGATERARRVGRAVVILRGPPGVDRVFTLTATASKVAIVDVDRWTSVAALLEAGEIA